MTTRETNRRKTRIVLREMQGRIIRHTTVLPLAALAVLTISVTVLGRKLVVDAAASEVALPHLELLLAAVLLLTSSMAGAILYVAFRFSHRVAGPSYRLIESLKRMERGDLAFRVTLRRGDFLTEVVDQLNATMSALQKRIEADAPAVSEPDPSDPERELADAAPASLP